MVTWVATISAFDLILGRPAIEDVIHKAADQGERP